MCLVLHALARVTQWGRGKTQLKLCDWCDANTWNVKNGVGNATGDTPDPCAGAEALLVHMLQVRMAQCDVSAMDCEIAMEWAMVSWVKADWRWCPVASPSNGLWCCQATNCNIHKPGTVKVWLLKDGHCGSAHWLVPCLQPSVCVRTGAQTRCTLVLGHVQLSVPISEQLLVYTDLAQSWQLGHPRNTRAEAQVGSLGTWN